MTARELNRAIKNCAEGRKKKNHTIVPDGFARHMIEIFIFCEFDGGMWCFPEHEWISEYAMQVKDRNGDSAVIYFDKAEGRVKLEAIRKNKCSQKAV